MSQTILRIATRGSELALWQAKHVQAKLRALDPGLQIEIVVLKTRGDKILDVPLAKIGGKGLFVKELEQALLDGRADLAVHSMKDVPMSFPDKLGLAVICEREDPTDALVSNNWTDLQELPKGACVGTSSLRRQCHIHALRPDLEIKFLRGNVNTRLRKLDEGEFDAIILASAGLIRLGMQHRITQKLPTEACLPSPGQGAIGIECRLDDEQTRQILAPLNHSQTSIRVSAERAMSKHLNGGCQVPIAGFAELVGSAEGLRLQMRGSVAAPDSDLILKVSHIGSPDNATKIGIAVAQELLSKGADKILENFYDGH